MIQSRVQEVFHLECAAIASWQFPFIVCASEERERLRVWIKSSETL